MSIEVLLIPAGIAAYSAIHSLVREARSEDLCEKCRATRVTEVDVAHDALLAMGATITHTGNDRLQATSQWGTLTFQKVGNVILGRVDGADEATTLGMLAEFDEAVGRVMQARTAQIVVERARALGFRLIEQREEDGSLNYVFEEA
jgi:hypothetical protein